MRWWFLVGTLVGLSALACCAHPTNGGVRLTVTRDTLIWPTGECGRSLDVSARWATFYVPEETMGTIESYRYGKDYWCWNVRFDDGRHGYVMYDGSQVFDAAVLSPLDEEVFPLF